MVPVTWDVTLTSKPDIFNTDQGVQFTSREFTGLLDEAGISISMDGRGRALDNIFVERLWRSVKYEEVYLNNYETVREARERLHQSLGYRTPREIYFEREDSTITSAG